MANLPQQHTSHIQEKKSVKKLNNVISEDLFILRSEDGGDYGVDRIIEVIDKGCVTNIRSHLQLKSKIKNTLNNKIKFKVPISNIHYLMNTLNSLFLVYSESEDLLYWEWVNNIESKIKASDIDIHFTEQETFTYLFDKILDDANLQLIHDKLIIDNTLIRELNTSSDQFLEEISELLKGNKNYKSLLSFYINGSYEQIIAMLKNKPNLSDSELSLISLCYYQIYNYQVALKYIVKIKDSSNVFIAMKIKACILCEMGIKDQKVSMINEAESILLNISRDKWDWMDLYNMGNILSAKKKYKEAILYYEDALKLDCEKTKVYKNLSNCYKNFDDFENEMKYLDKALLLDPNHKESLISKAFSLGKNYFKYKEAIDILENVIINEQNQYFDTILVYIWLIEFYLDSKQYEKAKLKILEALEVHNSNQYLLNLQVHAYVEHAKYNNEFIPDTVNFLENKILEFPEEMNFQIYLLEINSINKSAKEQLLEIVKILQHLDYDTDIPFIENMNLDYIVPFITNIKYLKNYRAHSDLGSSFYSSFDINFSNFSRIDLIILLEFSKLNELIGATDDISDIYIHFDKHGKSLIDKLTFITKIIQNDIIFDSAEQMSDFIAHIIAILPEILLKEFSRQIGWISNNLNMSSKSFDDYLINSETVNEWFENSIEPILFCFKEEIDSKRFKTQ